MAIYRLPPSPFVGGRQPTDGRDLNPAIEAVDVNDPPSKFKIPVLAAILIAWQPVPFQVQTTRFVPQVTEARVPFVQHSEILNSWNQTYYPQQARKLPVSVTAVAEDNPPFSSRTILPALITWNIPNDPIIQKYNKYIPEVIVADFVPYTNKSSISISNWQPNLRLIQTAGKIAPQVPEVVPDFVPNVRPNLFVTINYLIPQIPRKSAAIIPVDAVNDPPFGRRDWLTAVLSSWRLEPPVRQATVKYPNDSVIIADFLPKRRDWLYTILYAWVPEAPIRQRTNTYPIEPDVVNDPPFGRRVLWLNTVLDAWIPPPPMPTHPADHFTPPASGDIIIWLWKRVL